jgi:feruloyl esterase
MTKPIARGTPRPPAVASPARRSGSARNTSAARYRGAPTRDVDRWLAAAAGGRLAPTKILRAIKRLRPVLPPIAAAPAPPVNPLDYLLYLPEKPGKRALPLVVMLHGCQQTAEEFARGTRMNAIADREGFAVLYPRQTMSSNAYRCWNWYEELAQAGGGEARMIVALVAQIADEHPIDRTRIYVAGLSAGASMATILAVHYPHVFAAVGVHSGVVFGAAGDALKGLGSMRIGTLDAPERAIRSVVGDEGGAGMPAVLIHGERDGVVHPVNLTQLVTQYKALNPEIADVAPVVSSTALPGADGGADGVLKQEDYRAGDASVLRVYSIPDLDHAWSGGDGSAPFHSGEGPDASDLMWAFFEQHRRRLPG